jgi:hypothetical protein
MEPRCLDQACLSDVDVVTAKKMEKNVKSKNNKLEIP